jgi:hypothetical protein
MEQAFMEQGGSIDKVRPKLVPRSTFCFEVVLSSSRIPFALSECHHKTESCYSYRFINADFFHLPHIIPVVLSFVQGENARLSSFVGAIAIADLVKTTLGPKGMDKILQKVTPENQSISVTNDGATILKSVYLDNAAAKVLVDIAKVQDDEVGDGTTSVAVLCGELL